MERKGETLPHTGQSKGRGRDARATTGESACAKASARLAAVRTAYFARTLRRPSFGAYIRFCETNPPFLPWRTSLIYQGGSDLWLKTVSRNGGFVLENEPKLGGVKWVYLPKTNPK